MKRCAVPITEIVDALQREGWLVAADGLKGVTDWQKRTLMCEVDDGDPVVMAPTLQPLDLTAYNRCAAHGYVVCNICKHPAPPSPACDTLNVSI